MVRASRKGSTAAKAMAMMVGAFTMKHLNIT